MTDLDYQIKHKLLSHAYIFESANEDYNLNFSKEFANNIFKDKGVYIEENLNQDLYIIDKGSEVIDIETIRLMLKDVSLMPKNKKIKIYIIHNAQNMRKEGSNAILKTIEELKDYNMVIFTTTNRNLLLPTIRSRCQIVRLNTKKQDSNVDYDKLIEIISEVYKGNIGFYYQSKRFFTNYKNDKMSIVNAYMDVFEKIIDYKYRKSVPEDNISLNIKKLKDLSLDKIEEIISLLYTINIGFKNNINYDLAMDEIIYCIYKGGQ